MKVTNMGTEQQNIYNHEQQSKTHQIHQNQAVSETGEDYIELDLDALIKLGVVERNVTIGNTVFTLRTLTEEERSQIETNLSYKGEADLQEINKLKIPYLVKSIVKINGKPIPADKKDYLKQILLKMQGALIDMLFVAYAELVADQKTLIEQGVKKNSQ